MVTAASGTEAPLLSVTLPTIEPVSDCAQTFGAADGSNRTAATKTRAGQYRSLILSPCASLGHQEDGHAPRHTYPVTPRLPLMRLDSGEVSGWQRRGQSALDCLD